VRGSSNNTREANQQYKRSQATMQKKVSNNARRPKQQCLNQHTLLGHSIPNVASKPLKSTKFVCGVDT